MTSNRVVIRQQNSIVEYFLIAADGAVLREGTVPNGATVVFEFTVDGEVLHHSHSRFEPVVDTNV